eukprot:TRINITY_DN7198_c0_g1_i4.p1 TRINITY_DN7198_c0_g1~~TRINITY_DN7198_c0_g1_i4.p1  ORF type:complete len:440 (+),score=106.33 TRINITY_DN7198_c0_g1_i4:32-1321(+)
MASGNADLDSFLSKIDQVSEVVQGMTAGDDSAMKTADNLIAKLQDDSDGSRVKSERTVINTTAASPATVLPSSPASGATMEQQAFMTSFEQDAKERAARRLIRQKEGAVVKEQGNKAFKCKDYVQAEELYTKALSLWSDHLPLYTNRALVRLKLHRYQDALSDCDWALRLHDRHPKALNHQGVAYAALHDYEAAITSLTKAKRASTGAARTTIQATLDRVAKEQEQWEHAKAARQALDQNEDEDVRQIVAQVTAMMTSDDNVTSDVRVITGWDLTQADGQRKLIAMEQACRDFEQTCQQITTVYSNLDDSKTAVASRVFYISLPDLFLAKSNVISLYLSALDESIASLTLLARSSVTALLRLLDRIEQRTAWSDIAQDVYQSAAVQQRLAQLLSSKEALVGLSAGCLLQRLALEVPKVMMHGRWLNVNM